MERYLKYTFEAVACLLLAINCGQSQSFYNNGATVAILPGTILYVKDSLVNTGMLVNNGNLIMGGTWLNTGVYDAGTGEITFNSIESTTPQIINHSNQSFSKLTISGGGRKLILADITIVDEIVLADGIIEAQNEARVVISASATVSGGSDAAHIRAPVYHEGTGEKLFPLGDGAVYLPVLLPGVADPEAIIGIEALALDGQTLPMAPSLDAISSQRYWKIDVAAGVANSRISLPVRNEPALGDPEKWVVVEAPALTEKFESIGASSADGTSSDGTVTSDRNVSFPFVTLAATSNDGAVVVYNAISANGDSLNEFLRILNIEYYPDNRFTLFNRWGDKVFELDGYDNKERVFRGKSNINGEGDLVNGTYFYNLESSSGGLKLNGYIVLRK